MCGWRVVIVKASNVLMFGEVDVLVFVVVSDFDVSIVVVDDDVCLEEFVGVLWFYL